MLQNLDLRRTEGPSRSARSGALKKPSPYYTLVSEVEDGGAYIRTPGGEVVFARRMEDGLYEVTYALSPAIRVRVLRKEDVRSVSSIRMRLQNVLSGESLSHLSGYLPFEIPEVALPELEAITPADRFFHLYSGEQAEENVLGLPTRQIEVSGRVGITQIPAFRVDAEEGCLFIHFGHLRQAPDCPSGWVIYHHSGLVQVNGSTYFRH